MKLLFYGTPAVAAPFLGLLAGRGDEIVGVVTQPDKPAGRSLKVDPTPVKQEAQRLGLKVFQPEKPSAIAAELRALKPDLAVAVAYGRILKRDALEAPRLGTLNVHFSLLPKYRGAAPVQWSLARGETETGVTIFWLDEGMDTGPILLQRRTAIEPDEDASELMARLKVLGLEALAEAMAEIEAGRLHRAPQAGPASLAPLIKKEDARIGLDREAREIHNLVRGMRIWPRAFLDLSPASGPLRLLVLKTRLPEGAPASRELKPGAILRVERDGGILVQCSPGSCLWVLTVQPEGKNPVTAASFLNGLRLGAGDFLPIG